MKKTFGLFLMFSLFAMNAGFAGPFNSMVAAGCGTGANEYYHVSSNRCVECDDDTGNAPAKTRAYWHDGSNVWSRRCYIDSNLLGDDRWTDREGVSRCPGNICSDGRPAASLPGYTHTYICGKANLPMKTIGDSVFVAGGSSNAVDCWFEACAANFPVGTERDINCSLGETDPNATKCIEKCVIDNRLPKALKYISECAPGFKPGGHNTHGYTKCEPEGDNGGGQGGNGGGDQGGSGDDQKNCTDSGGTWANNTCSCDANNHLKLQGVVCVCEDKYEREKNGENRCVPAANNTKKVDRCNGLTGDIYQECQLCKKLPAAEAKWSNSRCICTDTNKQFDLNSASCVQKGPVHMGKNECQNQVISLQSYVQTNCNTLYSLVVGLSAQCGSITLADLDSRIQQINSECTILVYNENQKKNEQIQNSKREIIAAGKKLDDIVAGFGEANVWTNAEGKFNTARLASDSIAGVVLGTAGGLITSSVMKKKQSEQGFEDLKCVVGGQPVAGWGDEFNVGIQ